ncbi:tetratricopeptide repeat protein [Treponema sp.]|uniref:tetratricopeptide repeat protein n=1 Tax=Treponema sp. TaxID=166 RepID=UPI00388DA0FA
MKLRNTIKKISVIIFISLCTFVYPATSAEVKFAQDLEKTLNSGSIEKALALFEKMPAGMEKDTGLQTLKGSLLLSAGKVNDAEKLASELLLKEPKNIDVLALNAMVAKQKGNNAKKLQYLKQIIAIEPNNPEANIELGSEQALKRNYRNARDYYAKALKGDPDNLEALFGHGKMSYYLEKDDDSKQSFNKILELDPHNSQALSYLAKFEAEARQYKKAIEYVLEAVKYDSLNSDYYLDLGTYSRFSGKYADAEKYWKKAVELDPDYFLGYAYLAGLYDEQNKYDLAYEYYKKVVQKNPKYYYAYESVGMFAWYKGNYEESKAAFEEARKANPDNVSYALMVMACQLKMKKLQDMKKYAQSVMKGMDRNSLEFQMVRMYHDQTGDSPVTLKIQNEQSRSKRGKMLFYLALFYDIRGNISLAQKYYGEITEMQGASFFEARLALLLTSPN